MELNKRLFSTILAVVTITNITGCSKNINNCNKQDETIAIESGQDIESEQKNFNEIKIEDDTIYFEELTPEILDKSEIEAESTEFTINNIKNSDGILDLLNDQLFDESIDYNLVINIYLNTDFDKRENLINDYLRASYMLLLNSDTSIDIYLEELNNMAIMQQIPMCVPEDIWNKQFGHLLLLLGEYESLFDKFGPLAYYIHDLSCEEEHTFSEYGSYTCPNLQKEYKLILEPKSANSI